ncbi:Polysaccharide biosynthesis protein [uncultured archaeon]|nr:Polysaccharide biosynthesis protein [uncultured archaeon]
MSESTSKKIIRNTAYNYVGFLILVSIQFFSTPYIVRALGKDAYGVYALISVFIGYVGLLELGIGASIIKYVSEYYVENRYDKINHLVSTAFVLFLGLGFVGALIILVFREFFATSLFKVPSYLTDDTIFVFTVAGIAFFFTFIFGVFINVLVGLQRMDITNKISTLFGVLNIAGIVALLWSGYGLKEIVILSSANGIIGVLISAYISKRILRELSLIPRFFDRSYVKDIMQFSFYIFITKVTVLIYQNFGKLILGILLPIKYVTIYTIGAMLSGFIYRLSGLAVAPVMPASSELIAKKDTESIKELFLRGTKYVTIINIPAIVFLGIFAEEIIRFWMGEGFEESVLIFRILLIGLLIETLQHVGGNMLPGVGKPKLSAYYAVGNAILMVLLTIIFVKEFGPIGAALGVTISQLIVLSLFIPHLCKIFKASIYNFFNVAIKKSIFAGILAGLSVIILQNLNIVDGWMGLIFYGIVFILFYLISVLIFVLDEKDARLVAVISQIKILVSIKRYISSLKIYVLSFFKFTYNNGKK